MLKYELAENTDQYAAYRYFVEGNGDAGLIVVNKADGAIIHTVPAPEDSIMWYARKLYRHITKWIEAGTMPLEGTIAWY